MKCEICKKNEAQFYYKESINGKTTEKHLCAECAHKEGLDRIFEREANSMLTSFGKMMDSFLMELPNRGGGIILPFFLLICAYLDTKAIR